MRGPLNLADQQLGELEGPASAARPDVRLSIACKLYERGYISLGETAEMSGMDIVAMKDALLATDGERGQ